MTTDEIRAEICDYIRFTPMWPITPGIENARAYVAALPAPDSSKPGILQYVADALARDFKLDSADSLAILRHWGAE